MYTRGLSFTCKKCASKVFNAVKIVGIFIAVVGGLAVLVYINLRSTKESELSVILRILTNYV
jgi:hypothetical protein